MKNMKRILTVKFVKEVDTDPDFSYLGQYSAHSKDEYSIDRAHSKDCQSLTYDRAAFEQLERAEVYLYNEPGDNSDAEQILAEARDRMENCDCGERGDMRRGEWRYFNGVTENYAGCTPEEIRQYVRQDYERMEDYNNQGWCYMLTHAEAYIDVAGITQRIKSGYCGGTESDSGDEVFEELKADSLAELKGQLKALGFSARAISEAFKTVKDVDA